MLSRRTAAKIFPRDDKITRKYFFYEISVKILHAMSGKILFFIKRQVTRGQNYIRIYAVSIFENMSGHHSTSFGADIDP